MATTSKFSKTPAKTAANRPLWVLPLSTRNFTYIGGGIAVLLIGFILLSMGIFSGSWDNPLSVSIAPVVLVFGYCVVIPWAIMARSKNEEQV